VNYLRLGSVLKTLEILIRRFGCMNTLRLLTLRFHNRESGWPLCFMTSVNGKRQFLLRLNLRNAGQGFFLHMSLSRGAMVNSVAEKWPNASTASHWLSSKNPWTWVLLGWALDRLRNRSHPQRLTVLLRFGASTAMPRCTNSVSRRGQLGTQVPLALTE
jgi:hypothetical protein